MNDKALRRLARETRHLLRQHVLPPDDRQSASAALERILSGNRDRAGEREDPVALLATLCERYRPRRSHRMWEPVLVVTVVFLALRTFFVQSFTVTTGSMEPTLFGERWEHSRDGREGPPAWARALRDRLFSGVSHHFVKAKSTGIVGSPGPLRRFLWLSWRHIQIGDSSQTIWFPPPHLDDWRHAQGLPGGPWPSPGTRVEAGDWLLAGRFVRGERILVDRLSYNFVRPRRGQIVVLSTRGLAAGAGDPHPLEPFAVKRLVGLPGDRLAGSAVRAGHLFLMGDNRTRSLDSRHWGDIAMGRLVGRYWFRYWPLIRTASASN